MARRRIFYCLVLAGAFFLQVYTTLYLAAFLLALTLALPLVSLAMSLPAMTGCRVRVAAETPAVPRGGEACWAVDVENRRRLPVARISVWLRLENRLTGREETRRVRLSGASSPVRLRLPADTRHCGLLACRVERVQVCDGLGLFTWSRRRGPGALLPVLPHAGEAEELPRLEEEAARPPVLRVRPGGGAAEDYDLRPYRPGDPVRQIHWKLSSKREELVLREMLETVRPPLELKVCHVGGPRVMDRELDRVYTQCLALLERQRPLVVSWLQPVTGELRRYPVGGRRELDRCLEALLSDPAPREGASLAPPSASGTERREEGAP